MDNEEQDVVFTSKEIIHLIDSFLQKRTESETGGFSKVTQKEMHQLSEIFYKIIEAKWGRDADGDLPVKYDLLDWTRYQPMYWTEVPHHHRDVVGHIKAVIDNLAYASKEANRMFELIRYFNQDFKSMAEYVAKHHPDIRTQIKAEGFIDNWFRGDKNDD